MPDPAVTPEEVSHVADLARVEVADDQRKAFAEQFSDVLEYFEALDEVPAVDREPGLEKVLRADEVEPGLTQEEALANAPESEEGYFKGPRVS